MLYVNSNEMAWIIRMVPREDKSVFGAYCAECHGAANSPTAPTLNGVGQRLTREADSKDDPRRHRSDAWFRHCCSAMLSSTTWPSISSPGRRLRQLPRRVRSIPSIATTGTTSFSITRDIRLRPPWGTLNAIDLNKGTIAWTVPFGEYPKLVTQGLTNTGTDNYGGAIVTQNGLLIIAATTYDNKIRAYDKANGKLLWEAHLPAAGNTTPSTYMVNGKQYIVIACGGGKNDAPSGGTYVAFALP